MTQELRERVARAIYDAGQTWLRDNPFNFPTAMPPQVLADAAIAIIRGETLEEAAIEPWNIAAANHQLRIRLLAFITRYDRDNPMRTADIHDPDCGCMRCERDRAATLLSKSPLPPPPAGETEHE